MDTSLTHIAGSPDLSYGNTVPKNGTVFFSDLEGISQLLKDGLTVTAGTLTSGDRPLIGLVKHDVQGARVYGPITFEPPTRSRLHAITVQSDGKPLILASSNTDQKAFIARFNADGSLDRDFGENGLRNLNTTLYEGLDSKFGLAVQEDQKILAAFNTDVQNSEIWRLERDGQIDVDFKIKLPGVRVRDLLITPRGFVYAGMKDDHAIIEGYLPNGQVDSSFGIDGLVKLTLVQNSEKRAIALALATSNEDRIAVTGTEYSTPNTFNFVTRLLPNGTSDPLFNNGKPVETGTEHGSFNSLVSQDDGKVVVLARNAIGSLVNLVRYYFDGKLDPDFGNNGVAVAYRDPQGRPEIAHVNKLELHENKLQSSGSLRGASYIGRILSR
ncbi:hypothetical protein HZF02_22670 [Pseudomonas yamanorum]|nr:hypothetical protein HZF02_22670 [Pseudomonas yamanorum]